MGRHTKFPTKEGGGITQTYEKFANQAAIEAAYPDGSVAKTVVINEATDTVWTWDVDSGAWSDSGTKANIPIANVTGLQNELNNKQALNENLTEFSAVSGQRGDMFYHNGTAWVRLPAGTEGQSITVDANGDPIYTDPAGGLENLTEGLSTGTPNNIINTAQLLVNVASSNGDLVITPKGTGAIIAQVPDSASSGGNKRGIRAKDFQLSRTSASQVASGSDSMILAGRNNTASGSNSFASGINVNVSGSNSGAIGGYGDVSGSNSFFVGEGNNVNSPYSAAFGSYNKAYAEHTVAEGNYAWAYLPGMEAFASKGISNSRKAQISRFVLWRQTFDTSTPRELFLNGDNASVRAVIPDNTLWACHIHIIGREYMPDNSIYHSAIYHAVLRRYNGTVAMVGSPHLISEIKSNPGQDPVISISGDNTNKSLKIDVTGNIAGTVTWVAGINLVETNV